MPKRTIVGLVSVFLILTMFMTIDFSSSTDGELSNDTEVKYTVSDGPVLSSPDGIPGYPVTITAEVTGFSAGDVWSDQWGGYYGNTTNYGVFDCDEEYLYPLSTMQGYVPNASHVVPLDWVEDGYDDCYDGSDEVSGAANTVVSSSSQSTSYRIWAVSATGDEYLIRGNVSPIGGEISVKWDVDLLQPTGDYQICVDSIITSTNWDMGLNYWSVTVNNRDDRNLVLSSSPSGDSCTDFELNLYDLSLSSEHKLVIPGSTVKISGFVSNPITGGPSDPGSIDANLRYYTEDSETGGIVPQIKEIYVSSDDSMFEFAFLLPSNLYQGTSSYYWIIQVDVWANSSTTSQFEMETYTLYTSNLVASIISPAINELVYRDEPFVFQAEAILYTNSYYNAWEPLSEHDFSLKIKSDGHTTVLIPLMTSDRSGNILTIINLSSIDISGVATLTLEWENPSTMETDKVQAMIFVADNAYVANNIGKGLNLEATIVGDPPHEGEDVQVKITAKDDWGNPISSIYIQHTVQIEVDSSLQFTATNMFEQFGYDMTNGAGEVLITKSIPTGLNGAAVYLNAIGYNETGYLDSLSFEIPLAEPEVEITLSTGDYHPGDLTTIIFSCKYLQGEVTYFWSTISGESGYLSSSDCNSLSEVEIIIPLSQDSAYYSVMVTAVSNQNIVSVTELFPLAEENLEMDIVLFSHGVHVAGENITIEYNISIENEDGSPIYPLAWETSIIGYPDNNTQGELNSSVGSLNMILPDSLKSGSYIVNLRIGDAASYTIIDVLSQEDDQHREDDTILQEELESSIGYQISDLSGIIAIAALLMAIISLTIAAISRLGGKSEESNMKAEKLFNAPLASHHVSTDDSIQQESAPPLNAVGTLRDGFEWVGHHGKQYYRPAHSNDSWEIYQP